MTQMNYRELFPEAGSFLAGYFNQDWCAFYDWGSEQPSYQAVVLHWKAIAKPQDINQLVRDLAQFLNLSLSDAELKHVLQRQFFVDFLPPNMDYRQWLEAILDLLHGPAAPRRLQDIDELYPPQKYLLN